MFLMEKEKLIASFSVNVCNQRQCKQLMMVLTGTVIDISIIEHSNNFIVNSMLMAIVT